MSRTLFWYVFKDLLRIFLLASAALAGIMSFGGLLRPLTEHGLDAGQVTRVLGYFMPAMQTYSLPVAALFATTMVYGRLSADNELTACRAAGMGYWPIWFPALVLGLMVATVSLLFLCFIVPVFTLKVEKVIYSNLAQLVANEIEHNHHIRMEGGDDSQTIFAQKAFVLPSPPERPKDQVVQLIGPLFVRYEKQLQKVSAADRRPPPPEEFFTATRATAYISQNTQTGEVQMVADLTDGIKFPRRFEETPKGKPMSVSMTRSSFTSDPFPSPVRENVKFLDIGAINHLLEHPESSRKVQTILAEFVRDEQQNQFLANIAVELNSRRGEAQIDAGGGETYLLTRGAAPTDIRNGKLYIGPTTRPTDPQPRLRQLRTGQVGASQVGLDATAAQIRLRTWPDTVKQTVKVEADLIDTVTHFGEEDAAHSNFARDFIVPMPEHIRQIETSHNAHYYATNAAADPEQRGRLKRELIRLYNSAVSEKHARVSFALSCLVLVMVGCALGMMFKSGNFLDAFALSVVPALISIVLVVTGQHICENIPYPLPHNFTDPLGIGLSLIWSGNAAVLVMAVGLSWKLSRQ